MDIARSTDIITANNWENLTVGILSLRHLWIRAGQDSRSPKG